MFKRLVKSVQEEREAACKLMILRIAESAESVLHYTKRIHSQIRCNAFRLERIAESLAGTREAVLERNEAAKEDRLGPMLYDITTDDLFELSRANRMHVFNSGANFFNDIIPVRLVGVKGCRKASIKRIMEWRRSCVMRITEAQIVETIQEKQATQ